MKKLILFLALIPLLTMAQSRKERGQIQSFTGYSINQLAPFFNYMVYDLQYKAPGGSVGVYTTKTGYGVDFFKIAANQQKQTVTILFTTQPGTTQITGATITGPFHMLSEIFLKYFEGTVKAHLPAKGGIEKTYTATDEVRLYTTSIKILPNNQALSAD